MILSLTDEQPLTPVQLQKAIFLVQDKIPKICAAQPYEFKAYDYGPFCRDIYRQAAGLETESLAKIVQPPNQQVRKYQITSKGCIQAQVLWKSLDSKDYAYAKQLVAWVRSQTFEGLVSAIYKAYPQYKINSIFRSL